MEKIDEFKDFVRKNSYLISYVRDNKKSWQDMYELYDLYGDDVNIWHDFLKEDSSNNRGNNKSLNELFNMAKNVDIDKLQNGISSLQKAISLVGDLFINEKISNGSNYEPRPIYKRFDD